MKGLLEGAVAHRLETTAIEAIKAEVFPRLRTLAQLYFCRFITPFVVGTTELNLLRFRFPESCVAQYCFFDSTFSSIVVVIWWRNSF